MVGTQWLDNLYKWLHLKYNEPAIVRRLKSLLLQEHEKKSLSCSISLDTTTSSHIGSDQFSSLIVPTVNLIN